MIHLVFKAKAVLRCHRQIPKDWKLAVQAKLYLPHGAIYYRPIRRKSPQDVIRRTASKAIAPDIFDWPWARSMKVIGISPTVAPQALARRVISI